MTRGEPAAGVTPPLSLWSLLGCTRHSATPTTTLIFHGSFTLHWHFSQISNIKNPHFPTEFRYEGLNEATSRSPAIPCHCVMSDSRVSGQVATVSVKSLQSVGCCQGPGPEAEQDYTPDCHLISSGCGQCWTILTSMKMLGYQ